MMYDNRYELYAWMGAACPVCGKAALVGEIAVPCTCNTLQQG